MDLMPLASTPVISGGQPMVYVGSGFRRRASRRGYVTMRSRGYRRSRRGRRYGGGKNLMPYGIGAALGYLAPRINPMQDLLITAMAVAPIKLPRVGGMSLKFMAQGYVAGMIVKNFLPSIGGLSGSQDNFTV